MKLRSALLYGAYLALAFYFGTGAAQAQTTIDTMPFWNGTSNVSSFGVASAGVYGETFTAPGGPLTNYSFVLDDGGIPLNVIGQVYAWSGPLVCCTPPYGATGPALFSSAGFTIPGVVGFQTVTVNTGAVSLTTGNPYVILLADTGSPAGSGSNWGAIDPHPGVAHDGGFNLLFSHDPSLIDGQWDNFGDFGSLAYTATFGAVPEPATWAMLILGVGMIGLAARRRRKDTAIPA